MSSLIHEYCSTHPPLMPVVTVEAVEPLKKLMRVYQKHGINSIEITLRTDLGISAIRELRDSFPEALIAAGSVTSIEKLNTAIDAGANLIITPGITTTILELAREKNINLLPGVASPSELMTAMKYGFSTVKLFPAEVLGGLKFIEALSAPFPTAQFCPTGGVNAENVQAYLQQKSVAMIGGSWLAPNTLISQGDWAAIDALVAQAVAAC